MRESGPDRFSWLLLGLALLTRLAWVIGVHPPEQAVFSDMAHYLHRAAHLAEHGIVLGDRSLAWQAWGTHTLLAIPLRIFGVDDPLALRVAALMWAACSAGTVMLSYLLARRVLTRAWGPWPARAIGLLTLVWIPLLSHTGMFISETPYACALTAATLAAVALVQDGERPLLAGCLAAIAFVLRPQAAVFFVLIGVVWLIDRLRGGEVFVRVDPRRALLYGLPLVLALGFSLVRFRVHTGYFGGVAESATMNFTAGRCHNIVTQAYPDAAAMAEQREGRRISLPGFRALGRRGDDPLLALRPALGGESLEFVGELGDPEIHRQLRARCWAATGLVEQLRYSVANVALLWVIARPWPESSDAAHPELFELALHGRDLAALLAPLALLGMIFGLQGWRRDPALALVALQWLALLLVSAAVFGDPRLRTPHDPAALVLALAALARLFGHR
ncbi:hypothetical protein ACNOYE_14200 [Nannocystaceae bacterium ST9]